MPTPTLQSLLLARPQVDANAPQLPATGPETWLDKVTRGITTGLGITPQQPGDLASALGAAGGLLTGAIPMLGEEATISPQRLVDTAADLPEQALRVYRGLDSRISGLPPQPIENKFTEDPNDKLYRIMMERQQNNPRKPKY